MTKERTDPARTSFRIRSPALMPMRRLYRCTETSLSMVVASYCVRIHFTRPCTEIDPCGRTNTRIDSCAHPPPAGNDRRGTAPQERIAQRERATDAPFCVTRVCGWFFAQRRVVSGVAVRHPGLLQVRGRGRILGDAFAWGRANAYTPRIDRHPRSRSACSSGFRL